MKISFSVKCFFLTIALLFLFTSCEKKKQDIVQKKDNTAEIKKLLDKGFLTLHSRKSDSALFYYNKAQLLWDPKTDHVDDYLEALQYIAEILQKNGNFYEAETTLTKAFPYLDKAIHPKYAINVYSLLGFNYYRTFDYDKSLYYYRKALKKAISTFRKSSEISKIAFMYMQQKRYQEAIDLLEPLTKVTIKDKIVPSNTDVERSGKLYNLGLSYLRLGNHQKKTLDCFNESLELTLKSNDDHELIANYYALYLYYKKYENPALKKIYAQKAYDCSKRAKSIAEQMTTLGNLIEADDAKNSKKHWEAYIKLVDSIATSGKTAKNQFSNLMYDSRKDKEENLELKSQEAENELQLQRQKNRSFISYLIISFSVLVLVFLTYYITIKGKKEKNKAIFISEMRLSNKLHNEITEDIYKILFFTENHELENKENKENFLSSLNNIYIKTRKISKENSVILTDKNYEEGLKEMISGYTSTDLNIIINGLNTFSWSKIDRIKKITTFRVIQEIFDQAKKINNASLASITLKKDSKNIIITYVDNSSEVENHQNNLSRRFVDIENRIKSVKGVFDVSSNTNQKLKIFIKIPI